MKFVALLWIDDPEKNRVARPSHLAYIHELYSAGKVLLAGPFADGSGGMVIYDVASRDEAERLVREDPVVANGARRFELKEWTPLSFTRDLQAER